MSSEEKALSIALALAITTPDEGVAAEWSLVSERFASGMTDDQVESCKAQALKLIDQWEVA